MRDEYFVLKIIYWYTSIILSLLNFVPTFDFWNLATLSGERVKLKFKDMDERYDIDESIANDNRSGAASSEQDRLSGDT